MPRLLAIAGATSHGTGCPLMCPGSCAEFLCVDCRAAAREDKRNAVEAKVQRARAEQLLGELEAAKRETEETVRLLVESRTSAEKDRLALIRHHEEYRDSTTRDFWAFGHRAETAEKAAGAAERLLVTCRVAVETSPSLGIEGKLLIGEITAWLADRAKAGT